jgi:type IV pilus assembly protein PilA
MLSKLKKNKFENSNKGFTIIEVMIVLAIAGLILLIVFLAVPALQRNARNTQRKNDVQNLLASVSTYETNNAGTVPASIAVLTDYNPGYYTTAATAYATGAQGAIATDTLRLVTGAKCGAAGATVAGATRQVAAQYEIETSGAATFTCQDS